MRKLVFFLFFLVVFCPMVFVYAQTQPILLEIYPEFPKPGETVSFSIDSYTLDLYSSRIIWKVNGVVEKDAVGDLYFSTKAGPAGSSTDIDVEVVTKQGVINEGLTFWPADVTLLWETDGYTPPFYKGGSPYLLGSTVKLTAIPEFYKNGKRMDPKTLIYTWSVFSNSMPEFSGYGKNTFETSEISYTRGSLVVSVEVSAPDGIPAGRASLTFGAKEPRVVFYEKSSTEGILFNKALGNMMNMRGNEITIFASPYFFQTSTNTSDLSFDWIIDGSPSPINKNEISLARKGDQTGTTNLLLITKGSGSGFQSTVGNLSIVVE